MSGVARIVIGVGLVAASVALPGSTAPLLTTYLGASATVVSASLALGASLALSSLSAALAGRPRVPRQAVTGNVRGSTETHLIVFGERRVGGKIVQLGLSTTGGGVQDLLWIGIAHSVVHPGGCEGLQGLYVNDEFVPLASLGSLTGSTDVTHTGSGDTPINLAGQLNVAFYRGTGTQGADAASVAANIDSSTDYRRGICWTRLRLKMDSNQSRFQQAYPNGIPEFNAVLRGWRCYDPRLDSTAGGSGSQRANNPLTWTWTRNPALCAATYAITAVRDGGCGEQPAGQDWASVAAAANICDELISTPAGNQVRYTCDIVLDTADSRADNLQKILDGMGGSAPLSGGLRRYYAAAYRTPTTTIDDTWLRGPVEDTPAQPLDGIANRIVATFNDASNGWADTDTPEFAAASPLDADGDPLITTLSLPGVTRPYAAQYLAQIALRRARRSASLSLPLNLRGLDVMVEENVLVTLPELGLNNAVYRVAEWRWDGLPRVVLRADAASDYAPGTFTVPPTPAAVTTGGTAVPGAPQSLTAAGITGAVVLNWRSPSGNTAADPLIPVYVVERSYEDEATWVELTRVAGFAFTDSTVTPTDTFDYRVRAVNQRGQTGAASNIATAGALQAGGPIATAVQNPGFEEGNTGWIFGSGWSVVQRVLVGGGRFGTVEKRARTGLWSAHHTGAVSTALNSGFVAVTPGQRVTAQAWFAREDGGVSGSVSGSGFARLNWYDITGAALTSVNGPSVIGAVPGGGSLLIPQWMASTVTLAVAPASAAFARLEVSATGAIKVDDGSLAVSSVNNLDDVPDGADYARVDALELTGGVPKLSIAGARTLPTRNVPAVRHAGVGSIWSGLSITSSYDSASPANVTISASAATLNGGGFTSSFSASSDTVTQARGTTVTWRLYYEGSNVLGGGTFALVASSNDLDLVGGANRAFVGRVTVTVPGSGSGLGGGGSPGGGGAIP